MNQVILIGRLTGDPEIRHTQSNTAVTTFTVAADRRGEGADFIPCVAWRERAEFIAKYFTKGQKIALTGELQSRSYTDKNGQKRTVYEVNVNTAEFVERKAQEEPKEEPEELNDDLPF